jgi:hypothetical protein
MTSIDIMQDQITRARLAGEPPHVMLVPRLRHVGLMEFNRAAETIAEGRAVVGHALPVLKRYKDITEAHVVGARRRITSPWLDTDLKFPNCAIIANCGSDDVLAMALY